MSKSVLLSIKPKYCELIASGKKTIEVRKTKPKLDTPFKCYIYCTKGELLTRSNYNGKIYVASSPKYQKALERNGNITLSGKVIGEFVCNEIIEILPDNEIYGTYDISDDEVIASCLVNGDLWDYGKGRTLYGFHISDLVIYDKPRDLDEFMASVKSNCGCKNCDNCLYRSIDGVCDIKDSDQPLFRPPQSWYYV